MITGRASFSFWRSSGLFLVRVEGLGLKIRASAVVRGSFWIQVE